MKKDTILFDINETILDPGALKPEFETALGSETYAATWFSMLLHASTVCALTEVKTHFGELAESVLHALSSRLGKTLSDDTCKAILSCFASLKPHEDVEPALDRLRTAGYSIVAFSNSSKKLISAQINYASLTPLFNEVISVEEAGTFKPDPKAYRYAATRLNRPIETLRLVATHDWDTHGAMSAGMRAAYIDRTAAIYQPLFRKPDIYEKSMDSLVDKILKLDS